MSEDGVMLCSSVGDSEDVIADVCAPEYTRSRDSGEVTVSEDEVMLCFSVGDSDEDSRLVTGGGEAVFDTVGC